MISIQGSIDTIWQALEKYRETCIPEGKESNDQEWSNICTSMSLIQEDLEYMYEDQA